MPVQHGDARRGLEVDSNDVGSDRPWLRHPFLERDALPLFVAHRGGAVEHPESTRVAFDAALAVGADVLELDVHYTRDKEIVVMHDADVARTTDGSGPLAEMTLSEVRALDAGYHFRDPDTGEHVWRGRGVGVPTLEEILDAYPATRLNIDIKDDSLELADEVVSLMQAREREARTCLVSFHDRICRDLARHADGFCLAFPPADVAALVLSGLDRELAASFPYHVLEVPVRQAGLDLVDADLVEGYHALGFAVHVWTVDARSEMEALIELGVDGLMTDRPSVLSAVLAAYDGAGPPQGG